MANGTDGNSPVRFWQVLVGQLPWVIAMLALGGWYASKIDSRVTALEVWRAGQEARQAAETARQMSDMQQTIRDQTDEIKRMRSAVNSQR